MSKVRRPRSHQDDFETDVIRRPYRHQKFNRKNWKFLTGHDDLNTLVPEDLFRNDTVKDLEGENKK